MTKPLKLRSYTLFYIILLFSEIHTIVINKTGLQPVTSPVFHRYKYIWIIGNSHKCPQNTMYGNLSTTVGDRVKFA